MTIDRPTQLQILKNLEKYFPDGYSIGRLMAAIPNVEKEPLFKNLMYLVGHGLVKETTGTKHDYHSSDKKQFLVYTITSEGLDFLADDGGVSAILNTVTVKLHDETIRSLLLARIEKEVPDGASKSRLRKAIETMSIAGLKEIGTEAVKQGIASIPDIGQFLAAHVLSKL